jgi:polar amino acid transport system substrate-binding protein
MHNCDNSNEEGALSRRDIIGRSAGTLVVGAALGAAAVAGMPIEAARAQASAQSSKLHEVIGRGHLLVGTGSTNPPWHFQDEKGELIGMDIDMARQFAKGLFGDPSKIEFVQQSADARVPNLITNKVDIVCQFMTISAERARQVAFTRPYYREGVGLVLPKNSKYNTFDDLKKAGKDLTLAWLQNAFVEEQIRKILPEVRILQLESIDAAYQAILSGRADVAATGLSIMRWNILKNPDKYKDTGFAFLQNSYAFAVRQGDPVWLGFIDTIVRETMIGIDFDASRAMYKRWFGQDVPPPQTGFPSEYGIKT